MANNLGTGMVNTILQLNQKGWSQRKISRQLGIDRETVRRHISLYRDDPKPATNAPPGSGLSNPATNALIGSGPAKSSGPQSDCEPYRKIIEPKVEQGFTIQRIWQDLRSEHSAEVSYHSVRRFVNSLGKDSPIPFRRMETTPAEQAQIDFGTGAPIVSSDGRRRKTHVIRVVLSFSRKAYSEAVFGQTTENFIRCLENAFWHFGGVPETLVIDNLKAAVHKADWYDPEIHPRIQSFCIHYNTSVLPCKPYTPRHKGKVERGISYVKSNALKGRKFSSLSEQNQFLLNWETRTADTRIHGTTRQQVGKLFREQEKPHLLRLPAGRFPSFAEASRSVHRDGHIEVAKAYYSVPPEYTGRKVWARWDGHLVRIFDSNMKQITMHIQVEAGKFQTRSEHIHSRKISPVENNAVWLLERIGLIGENADKWAQSMLEARGVQGIRVLTGLLHLADDYDFGSIDRACEIALSHGAYRLRTVKNIIRRGGNSQQQMDFIDEHPVIRDMSSYEEFVRSVIKAKQY